MYTGIVVIAVAGALMLGILAAVAVYGARTLPPDCRLPVHGGAAGWDHWREKKAGLLTWTVGGGLIYLLLVGVAILIAALGHSQASGVESLLAVITPVAMLTLVITEYRAIKAALRRAGS
jgi:hypothetical protein